MKYTSIYYTNNSYNRHKAFKLDINILIAQCFLYFECSIIELKGNFLPKLSFQCTHKFEDPNFILQIWKANNVLFQKVLIIFTTLIPHCTMFFFYFKTFSNLSQNQVYKLSDTWETKAYIEKNLFACSTFSIIRACGFSDIFQIPEDHISFWDDW